MSKTVSFECDHCDEVLGRVVFNENDEVEELAIADGWHIDMLGNTCPKCVVKLHGMDVLVKGGSKWEM